jgi:hypothetical protein
MALVPKELLENGTDAFVGQLRFIPREVLNRTFTAGTGTIERGEPVAHDGTNFIPFAYVDGNQTEGTAEVIVGFAWPEAITLAAGGEVVGGVMMAGEVDYKDVQLPASGATQGQMEAALAAPTLRKRNLIVTGGLTTNP